LDSLQKLADNLVIETRKLLHYAKTEEDLRIGFEKLLEQILHDLGIKPSPKYERTIINAGRPDALHGLVVVEYEPPLSFRSPKSIDHAFDQLVGYIKGLSQAEKESLFVLEIKFIGVGFDGEQIFFVRYKGVKKKPKTELDKKDFVLEGPYDFTAESAIALLIHLRALALLPLSPENLAEKFGPKGELAPKAVSAFADALKNWGDHNKVHTYFNEWKRLFGIVYGEQFNGTHKKEEAEVLVSLYKVAKDTDFQELLFSVHTYFAFLMKLIAMELLNLRDASLISSMTSELANIPEEELKNRLEDIENGGVYARKGITNFLEGDFFRWYLEAWSPRLNDAIQDIARKLSEFEPATSTINPAFTRDLLKKLYQYLVPQEVRHRLGEYYTPDWLAELVLNEVGYDGNNFKRVLDPACGSGTFLVMVIQKAKVWGIENKRPAIEIAKSIRENIWGFDLNPLAVIAARTNYLFAMGDLANKLRDLEIPIYLADSVLWPERAGQLQLNFAGGENIRIQTSVGYFHIPNIWVKNQGILMRSAAPLIEQMVKQNYSAEEALARFEKEGLAFPPHQAVVQNFYKEIMSLEKQGKNGIWARFLKNIFAPVMAGQFDFVVGNPPWIRWAYLSEDYKQALTPLLKTYGLYQTKDFASRNLGVGEKDFSMLFTYAAIDYYLKNAGKLGFLITQEVFKARGSGEGFRKFGWGEKQKLKVFKALDLVSVQPFEGASNKTAAIFIKKGQETSYPVNYIVYKRKKGIGKIPTDLELEEASPLIQKIKLIAKPMGTNLGPWQTYSEKQIFFKKIEGVNVYQAWRGTETDPYGVHLLKIIKVLSNEDLLIQNLADIGKKKIQKVEERIEKDLIYPAVRGKDIERWIVKPEIYVLFPVDAIKKEPYSEKILKNKWPRTYSYLTRFRKEFDSRGSKAAKMLSQKTTFYAMLGYGAYTISKYKVIWKRMANDLIAGVISHFKAPYGYKVVIPIGTTSFYSTDNEKEAHYLCAVMNSTDIRNFIKSYSSAGRGFGSPSVMKHIGIPQFDPKNKLHQQLASLSSKCHQLKAEYEKEKEIGRIDLETLGREKEIWKLEKENDELVKKLFGID
jgi:hypothetical protein